MDLIWVVAGTALIGLAVADVWRSVLHADAEGTVAKLVRRAGWWLATLVGAWWPSQRRRLLALVGPAIVVLTFVLWIGLLILGFALVVWSMLPRYAAEAGHEPLHFVDALYYAGGTVTVLGFGDIVPLTATGKVLAVLASGLGFAMLTGMASYVIELVSGLSVRNRFALAVHDDVREAGGVTAFAVCSEVEGVESARQRCRVWAEHIRTVDELVHRYPLAAFTYRSRRPAYDPEPALRHAAETAVAALVATEAEPTLQLQAAALSSAVARLQQTVAEGYLPSGVVRRLVAPAPAPSDHEVVARLRRRLVGPPRGGGDGGSPAGPEAAIAVYRARVFLAALRRWTRSDLAGYEWEAAGPVSEPEDSTGP